MFQELLIPINQFRIEKKLYGNMKYYHPKRIFEVEKIDNKWSIGLLDNFDYLLDVESEAQELIFEITEKMFPTIKQARQDFIDMLKPYLSLQDFNLISQPLKRDSDVQTQNIVTDEYAGCREESPVYIVGQSGSWHIEVDILDYTQNTYQSYFKNVFKSSFNTRKQALETMYSTIQLNLDQLYFQIGKEHYVETKNLYQSETDIYSTEHYYWWVMFTRPDIDLTTIFK